jgi:hypothetical protein
LSVGAFRNRAFLAASSDTVRQASQGADVRFGPGSPLECSRRSRAAGTRRGIEYRPMFGFIDPPTPFSPVSEWREFLAEMESIVSNGKSDRQVHEAIANAEKEIKKRGVSYT